MKDLIGYLKAAVIVVYAPEKTFRELEEKGLRSPWPILLTLMVLTTIVSLLAAPLYMKIFLQEASRMEQEVHVTITAFYVRAILSGLIFFPIMMAIEALVFYIFAPLAEAEVSFNDMFQVVAYSAVITFIAQVITVIFVAATGIHTISFSPAVFLPPDSLYRTFWGRFLSQLNIFSIWSIYIVGVGMAVRGKTVRSKALILVFSVWIVWKIFVAILSGFAPRFQSSGGTTS